MLALLMMLVLLELEPGLIQRELIRIFYDRGAVTCMRMRRGGMKQRQGQGKRRERKQGGAARAAGGRFAGVSSKGARLVTLFSGEAVSSMADRGRCRRVDADRSNPPAVQLAAQLAFRARRQAKGQNMSRRRLGTYACRGGGILKPPSEDPV